MLAKIHPSNFTWQLWKGGCLVDLGLQTRTVSLVENKDVLKKYAIGYCNSVSIPCRPKPGTYAVMFQKDDLVFWTHLLDVEFEKIFKENG